MKIRFLIIGLIVLSSIGYAQNLVPNGSFEIHTTCPDQFAQINLVQNWLNPASGTLGTPDYFDSCGTNGLNVPNTSFGFQNAKSGNAFVGVVLYETGIPNAREYVEVKLTHALIHDKKYRVQFSVNLTDSSKIAINRIGVYFSNYLVTSSDYLNLPFIPQIVNDTSHVVNDKSLWFTIDDTLTAHGGESYMTIGNFFPDSLTTLVNVGGYYDFSYYLIDDVSVTGDTIGWAGIEYESPQTQINIYPNPTTGKLVIQSGEKIQAVEVYNLLGEKIFSSAVSLSEIDLSKQPGGIYFLSAKTKDKIIIRKIIKQ